MAWWDFLTGQSQNQPPFYDPTMDPRAPVQPRARLPLSAMTGGGVNNPSVLQPPPPPLQSPLDPVNQSASAIVPPPVPGVTVNTNPVIGQSIGPQAAIDAAPYPYSGQAPAAKGMTPSQVGQTVGGRTTAGGLSNTGGISNPGGSYNKGWGTPDSAIPAPVPAADGSLNKGDGAPAAGGWGSKLAGVLGNDKIMGGIAGLASGLRGGSQGSGASAPLPPPPNLSDNSAAIAQQAPQLMAASLAKRKKTPGLSLSGVNRGFGGGAG